ncbi:MAG: flagellar hook-associated protein FlgK [Alphaproteobacteria bacterium]
MSSLDSALNAAYSGLRNSQFHLSNISSNIANANTPGYTRKVVVSESVVMGNHPAGVNPVEIYRLVNEKTLEHLKDSITDKDGYQKTAEYFERIHQAVGSSKEDPGTLLSLISKLHGSFQDFATTPIADANTSQQQLIMTYADSVVDNVKELNDFFIKLKREIAGDVDIAVTEFNGILDQLVMVNKEIDRAYSSGMNYVDLLDQRDLVVQKLSGKVDITVFEDSDMKMRVMTKEGILLVDGINPRYLNVDNDLKLYAGGSPSNSIEGTFRGGELKSLFEMYHKTIPAMQEELYTLSMQLITDTGSAVYDENAAGNPINISLFERTPTPIPAPPAVADPLTLDEKIAEIASFRRNFPDSANAPFATFFEPTQALTVAKNIATNSLSNFQSFTNKIATDTFNVREDAAYFEENYEYIMNQHLNSSAVDLDEEMTKLIMMEQAYNASARVLSMASDMFKQLFSILD